MDFDSFVGLIARSCPADWNVIVCWGYGSGPSYKSKFEYNDIVGGKVSGVLSEESHGMYACIKSNILVSLAFGLTANDDFREPWANGFPDPSASSHYLDLFYSGSLVHRITYVLVDGGRAKLPIPDSSSNLAVDPLENALIKLIDDFESVDGNYEEYFRRAGLRIK